MRYKVGNNLILKYALEESRESKKKKNGGDENHLLENKPHRLKITSTGKRLVWKQCVLHTQKGAYLNG